MVGRLILESLHRTTHEAEGVFEPIPSVLGRLEKVHKQPLFTREAQILLRNQLEKMEMFCSRNASTEDK